MFRCCSPKVQKVQGNPADIILSKILRSAKNSLAIYLKVYADIPRYTL